jgi:hypothetical protein
MKKVLAMLLVASYAYAEEPAPPPPPPEQPAPEQPAPDPAYGEKPERDLADGGAGYFAAPKGKDIYIKQYPDRSRANVIGLWTTAGAGVVLTGVGLAFHLDYRSKANDLSSDRFTGEPWTAERQATFDDAHSSSVMAGVFYGLGGATLLAATIAFIVTEPKVVTIVIHPHVDPKNGGAMIGGGFSF